MKYSASIQYGQLGGNICMLLFFATSFFASATGLSFDQLQGLTYLQVKGSGLANTCPVIVGGSTNLRDLPAGDYSVEKFCIEPTSFQVKDTSQYKGGETSYVDTKLMTRLTYTLDDMRGKLKIGGDGKICFLEEDGLDYSPTTVEV